MANIENLTLNGNTHIIPHDMEYIITHEFTQSEVPIASGSYVQVRVDLPVVEGYTAKSIDTIYCDARAISLNGFWIENNQVNVVLRNDTNSSTSPSRLSCRVLYVPN